MKLFIALLTFMASSMGYANCTFIVSYDPDLRKVVHANKGWNIEEEKYNKICNRLNSANLGVHFNQLSMISHSASVAAIFINFYPLDVEKKYGKMVLTSAGYGSMYTDTMRTTATLDAVRYDTGNKVLLNILENEKTWKDVIDQATFIRKNIK